jgi:hypothetical protein
VIGSIGDFQLVRGVAWATLSPVRGVGQFVPGWMDDRFGDYPTPELSGGVCFRASGLFFLEAEMTSAIGVERTRERRFLFQCPCGKNIVTSEKTVICSSCGKAMEVHRVKVRRRRQNPEPLLWPLIFSPPSTPRQWHRRTGSEYHQLFCSVARTRAGWHSLESPDYNEHYLRLGVLILLSPIWVPLLWILLSPIFAPVLPEQDRPHHYERHDIHLVDAQGGVHTIPRWTRVDD